MSKLFSRWPPCLTLASWSAILLYFYFSGRINAFLVPAFRPGLLAAGLVLAGMAGVFLFVRADAECCTTGECGHPLARFSAGRAMTFLILLVPMLVAAFFSPDAFGKTTMQNRGIITDASALGGGAPTKTAISKPIEDPLPTKDAVAATPSNAAPPAAPAPGDYLQHTPEGFIVAEVLDLLYAAQDNELRKDFEGKQVQLVGQLMPDATRNASGKRFKTVRMFMTCCAADARPVATLVEAAELPKLAEMTWIKVTGTATFPTENGRRTSVLVADKVERTDPPDESMLY